MIEDIKQDYQEVVQEVAEATQEAQNAQAQELESTQEQPQSDVQANEIDSSDEAGLLNRIVALVQQSDALLDDFESLAEQFFALHEKVEKLEKEGVLAQEPSPKTSSDNFAYIDKLVKDDTLEREKAMKEEILQEIKSSLPKKKSNGAQNIINFIVIFGMIVLFFLITRN